MTAWERAHGMIDTLPEDSVNAVIRYMARLVPEKKKPVTPKMEAFLRLQKMRKTAPLNFSMEEREKAMEEKYGQFTFQEEMDCDYIVTENISDFIGKSQTKAVTPQALLSILQTKK